MARYDDAAALYDDLGTLYDTDTTPGGSGDLSGALKTITLLDSPFDSAFYSGAPVTSDQPRIYKVSLNGRQYAIDPKQYRRNTLPTLRPPQDNSTEPGEQSLNTESVWRRSQGDWILGAGQTYYDDLAQPASNRTQFYTSVGIDPWTRRELTLHHATKQVFSSTNTNVKLFATPSQLYATVGQSVMFTDTPDADAPIWTTVTLGGTASAEDMTSVGATLYVACGADGVWTTSFGTGTATNFSAYNATRIAFVNGFLVGAKNGDISTIDSGGTANSIYTHFDSTMEWTDIVATPQGAFICGNTFGKAEMYFIGIDTTTGDPLPPVYAGGLPNGETVNGLVFYDGLMLIATSRGLRLADITSQNGLNHGPLISIAGGVEAFEPQGEFCWFSWSNLDTQNTGLGRALLSRDTEPGIPAYASDLMATAQGLVTGIASFGGKRFFSVASVGIYAESDSYVPTGTIDSGFVRFGTIERKIAVSLDCRHDALAPGASVTLSLVKDDETTVQCGVSNDVGTLGPHAPFPCQQASAEALRVVLVLHRGAAFTDTPTLRRWTLRATPTPFRTDEIIVPLMIAEQVSSGEEVGANFSYVPIDEFEYLKGLESARLVVQYVEGSRSYSVQVDRVMVRPHKWTSDQDTAWFNGLIFVRLLTVGA